MGTIVINQQRGQNVCRDVTKNLRMQQEQQDLQIVAWMQNKQDITKAYIHYVQNSPLWKGFYSENTKPNVMKMGDFLYGFRKSVECKLILPSNFILAGNNFYEPLIDEVHVVTVHGGIEKRMLYLRDRYQSQSLSALVHFWYRVVTLRSELSSRTSLRWDL